MENTEQNKQTAQSLGYNFSGVDKPKNENDLYGLRYAEFTVPLVKAVQEQQKEIEELKLENAALRNLLETELAAMKAEFEALKGE